VASEFWVMALESLRKLQKKRLAPVCDEYFVPSGSAFGKNVCRNFAFGICGEN